MYLTELWHLACVQNLLHNGSTSDHGIFEVQTPEGKRLKQVSVASRVLQVSSVVVCGVEAHVCVLATCQDLLQLGYEVHVAADCCSSRSRVDRELAYTRMQVGHTRPRGASTGLSSSANGSVGDQRGGRDPRAGGGQQEPALPRRPEAGPHPEHGGGARPRPGGGGGQGGATSGEVFTLTLT